MPYKDAEKRREAQRKADAKRGKRTRSWACIVYPESAPSDWVERLAEGHVECLISPLHDSDVTADGTPKKSHFHVLALFEHPASEKQARELFSRAGVTAPPEAVASARGYGRYLCHLDDHDKHRYDEADVVELCGASWKAVALDEAEAKDKTLNEIEDWLDEYNVVSYRALCRYARQNRPDWTQVIRSSTIHLSAYVRSAAWEATQEQGR